MRSLVRPKPSTFTVPSEPTLMLAGFSPPVCAFNGVNMRDVRMR